MTHFIRFLLLVNGLMCVIYGLVVCFNTEGMANYMGLAISNNDGRAELITMYTGMSLAVGGFMLLAAFTKMFLKEALLFTLIFMTGITLGRLGSFIAIDTGDYILNALFYDIPFTLMLAFAYFKRPQELA